MRRTSRHAERLGRRTVSDATGLVQRVRHLRPQPKPDMDDVTLARKVETIIFRGANSPKGKVDVNVVDHVVWLRGEVKTPNEIKSIEAKVRAIPEVEEVQNLLHLPKTPAPTRTDTPSRQRKTSEKRAKPATPRAKGSRFNAEREPGTTEPAPGEMAAQRSGRQAAPLGGEEGGEEGGGGAGGPAPAG